MINIKVNGIVALKQLKQLDGLDIEFAGFDFHKPSPWYIGDKIAAEELRAADFDIRKVGVFVDADFEKIRKAIDGYGLDAVQLQGEESPYLCEQLSDETEVIKAFNISNSKVSIEELIEDYDEVCDYYLFHAAKQADWKQLDKARIEKPFFLSGGIGPGDFKKLKSFSHPDFFGVDINEQFEKSIGVKDMITILQFKQGLK
ncbi:MAG TPA: phosphoribosylanthranilate isomerase [Chitinophagaceae bacterium]|nr:phosphoribosylanthranilate isomerase [Chitinophagaceae bacterium]